jgi:hypothetical protein
MDAELKAGCLEVARIASCLVGALRRGIHGEPPIGGGEAVLALLFAAARVHRLRGGTRETFVSMAGTFWDLAADEDEVERSRSSRKDG